jgi:mercuric ion binding protein
MKLLTAFLLSFISLSAFNTQAQTQPEAAKAKGPAIETVQFKTSAVCDMCKARLEKSLAYEKGVQTATLDVPSQVLTVSFRPDKTSVAALRTAVQKTGYDADGQLAEAKAYDRLPDCCKKTNSVH